MVKERGPLAFHSSEQVSVTSGSSSAATGCCHRLAVLLDGKLNPRVLAIQAKDYIHIS